MVVRACAPSFSQKSPRISSPLARPDFFSRTWCFGIITGFLLLLLPTQVAFAYTSPGSATGYVNDFAHVLSSETIETLNTELSAFEASTSNQIAVVTVPNMDGDYVENYAVKLFEEWGIGGAKKDNGVLLLVAVEEHKLRIEVGYGLEGALPDSIAQSIINNDLTPNLKEGNFDQGVSLAVRDIMLATQNEYVAGEDSKFSFSGNALEAIFVVVFIALQWMAAILARSKSWWLGGIVGGVLGAAVWLWFGFVLVWGGLLTVLLIAAGLLLDFFVSRSYTTHKSAGDHIPWWAGGGVGSSGSSSGGFGGFGGGSSGGGGASGGW